MRKLCGIPKVKDIIPFWAEDEAKESVGEQLRQPVATRTTGAVFILVALLIIAVTVIAHMAQTVVFDIRTDEIIFHQLDIYFMEYFTAGSLFGVFIILGISFIRSKKAKT